MDKPYGGIQVKKSNIVWVIGDGILKILACGDIHYPREEALFFNFLRFIEKEKPDLIILCGDILNYANIHNLDKFLRKIHRRAKTRIVAVMGNHDFWIIRKNRKTGESWGLIAAYSKALCKYGDILLWDKPYIHDDFIIVGIPGWYDFSYAPFELGFR